MEPSSLWAILSDIVTRLGNLHQNDPVFREGYRYTVWHVVRIHLFLLWRGFSSNLFYQNLSRRKGFRRHYGLPTRLISHSQFKKRRKSPIFLRALLEFLRYSGARALRLCGSQEVKVIAMDLTRIRSDPNADPYGAWGVDSRGFFYGYKLGLITSEHGVVLGLTLMKANWNEFRVNRKLLRMARETLTMAGESFHVDYLVCDSGFDGETTYEGSRKQLGAWTLCRPRRKRDPKATYAQDIVRAARKNTPYRFKAHLLWMSPLLRRIYHKRIGVERVNGQIKDDPLRIDHLPRIKRPIKLLLTQCLGKAILFNLCLIVNAQDHRNLRGIKWVLAS